MAAVRARLASKNPGKLRELRALLPEWQLEALDADDYPPEDGETYLDNARGKALFGRTHAPDAWVLGEDSGIEVEGLDWGPGVESARWAGGDEAGRMLVALAGNPRRNARYVCELVALAPDGTEYRGTGMLTGRIADAPHGHAGFGYDPVFIPDGELRTVAELGNGWKRVNSHRARAAAALHRAVGSATS
ncbi:MAG: non-canonical purine NTP pyrophosphatase [Gaiellaceae bacterium]